MGDLTMIRSLGLANVPSIVITTEPDDIKLRSRYAHGYYLVEGFAAEKAEKTCAQLVELARRLRPFVSGRMPLFYGTDAQLAFVHRFRDVLSEGYLFLLNSDELAHALWDKELFFDVARRAGVPVPRTARGDDLDELSRLRAPLLVKPRTKIDWKHLRNTLFLGGAKARVFGALEELLQDPHFTAARGSVLVQEHIPGTVRDLYSFHGFVDREGSLLSHYVGRKIRTYPERAGESSFIELVHDDRVAELGMRVAAALGVRGVFKIDVIRDERDGSFQVLEVNARYNLWNYLGAVHGVNLPLVAYEYLVHGAAPRRPSTYRPRYRWLHFYRDYKAYRERDGGPMGLATWAASIATSRNVYESFAWTDPQPFGAWAVDALRRKLL